jgi:hypothetical protein
MFRNNVVLVFHFGYINYTLYISKSTKIMTNIIEYKEFFYLLEKYAYEVFLETSDEINEARSSSSETALKNKAKKTGFPLGILRKVYKRGFSAWKKGHVPGVTPQQWAMARVNSFSVGGRTTEVSDGALYRQAKKARAERRKKKK